MWFARHYSKCLICMTYGIITTTEEAGTGITWRGWHVLGEEQLWSGGTVTPEPALYSCVILPSISHNNKHPFGNVLQPRRGTLELGRLVHSKTQVIFSKCVDIHLLTHAQRGVIAGKVTSERNLSICYGPIRHLGSEMCSVHPPVVFKVLLAAVWQRTQTGWGWSRAEKPGQRPGRQATEHVDLRDSTRPSTPKGATPRRKQ